MKRQVLVLAASRAAAPIQLVLVCTSDEGRSRKGNREARIANRES